MDRAGRHPRAPLTAGPASVPGTLDHRGDATLAGTASAGLSEEAAAEARTGQARTGQTPGGDESPADERPADGPGGVPAGSGAAWLPTARRIAASPAARQVALLISYLVAGVAVTWPRASYLKGLLPSSRDSASYVWGFWWVARQVTHLSDPWSTGHMAAPVRVDLGFHTLMPLPGLLLTPVTLAFGPSVSYNLLVAVIPGLLCYAMYRAARMWLPSQTGAIAAGAFFGLSSMLTQQDWYHVNIAAGAMFLPMALEASVRLRRRPGPRQALILGLVMGGAVLTDPESAVLAAILTLLALLPWLLRHPSRSRLQPAGLAVLAGAIVASPQIISMVQELGVGKLSIDPRLLAVTYKLYGVGLPGMFAPTPRVADFGLTGLAAPFLHSRDNEGLPMFGVLLTALAVFGLVVAWRRGKAWLLALMWIGCAALALGSSLWIDKDQFVPLAQVWHGVRVSPVLPYTWFVRIPGLSSFREADRLAILGLVPAALLAGAAVNWLRYHARPLIVVVLAVGILEAGYSGNPKVGHIPTALPALDGPIAADHSNSIVVDVPYGLRGGIPDYGGRFDSQALVMATADGHPRAIAYVSRVPTPTINAIKKHAFYTWLIHTQHYTTPAQNTPLSARQIATRSQPIWARKPSRYTPVTPGQLAAARQDARRLDIGWVVVWYRNPILLNYLADTGFRLAYRADGVAVYRPAAIQGE